MPRRNLFRSKEFPYHVVNRSNDRKEFPLSMPENWNIFTKILNDESVKYNTRIHAFVLMPNHHHLILSTPDENIDDFMRDFQVKTSKRLSFYCNGNGHRFESRYKWSLIGHENYYRNCIRYLYQNPVRAKIVPEVGHYPYSTFGLNFQNSRLKQNSIFNFEYKESCPEWTSFVLRPLSRESLKVIKKGLQKGQCVFSFRSYKSIQIRNEVMQDLHMTQPLSNGS